MAHRFLFDQKTEFDKIIFDFINSEKETAI
jgi:hypothetical protein